MLCQENDPAFVGEYLRTVSPVKTSYVDWRLIPGSALRDQGYWDATNLFTHPTGGPTTYEISYPDSPCVPTKVSTWDHESYGNPRIVDGAPDIGFDETQLGLVCGSWANHTNSHNLRGQLNPAAQNEQDTPYLLLPKDAFPGGSQLPLAGKIVRATTNEVFVPPTGRRAWTIPPGSLTQPTMQSNAVPGYDLLYTSNNQPLPWQTSFGAILSTLVQWPNYQGVPDPQQILNFSFYRVPMLADPEGPNFTSWANIQVSALQSGQPSLFGNLQPEFR